jgi:hypothetical protein
MYVDMRSAENVLGKGATNMHLPVSSVLALLWNLEGVCCVCVCVIVCVRERGGDEGSVCVFMRQGECVDQHAHKHIMLLCVYIRAQAANICPRCAKRFGPSWWTRRAPLTPPTHAGCFRVTASDARSRYVVQSV